MSKARQKGTVGENIIRDLLIQWGHKDVKRTSASTESHDIWLGDTGVTVEVKYRKAWSLFKWIARIRNVSDDNKWVIFAIHGDRRSTVGKQVDKVAVMDADFASETAQLAKTQILQQAGISVLAQANAQPQNILALLQ